jgi:putative ABC transport system permease protein
MHTLWNDLRYGFRLMLREPVFSGLAIIALALGIGANTAIFSMVNGILLRPLPYKQPRQLYVIREIVPKMGKASGSWPANLRNFDMWQHQNHSFEQMAVVEPFAANLTSTTDTREIDGVRVSSNLFSLLGVSTAFGRTFQPEEEVPGRDRVIILTHAFWRDQFHSDPDILGKSVTLAGVPYQIVGVLQESFRFPKNDQLGERVPLGPRTDFFKPLGYTPSQFNLLGAFRFGVIARMKPGVSETQAVADLNVTQAQIAAEAGSMMGEPMELRIQLLPLEAQVIGSSRRGLILLLASVAGVLLVVCVNLASLLLARASRRLREAAIRKALGASRRRLISQMLLESAPLALIGGLLGIGCAYLGLSWLIRAAPIDLPRLDEVHIDARVCGFAILLTLLTSVLFGLLPAWRTANSDPQQLIKSGGSTSSIDRPSLFLRNGLIGFEVGLTALLLIVAGTLTSSLVRVLSVDKGFDADGVLTLDVALPPQKYSKVPDRVAFYDQVQRGVSALPGVRSVGWISKLPLEGQAFIMPVNVPELAEKETENFMANYRYATPDYFKSMGISLLRGRFFAESDRQGNRSVAIISDTVAQRVWPKQNPIGRQFHPGPQSAPLVEIVGVVSDVKTLGLDQPVVPMVYVPHWQMEVGSRASLVVRAPVSVLPSLAGESRGEIRKTDPEVPVLQIRSMDQIVTDSVAGRKFQMLLAQWFAAFALFLAALGIYSVVSYSVEQRRYELGIRLALGASPSSIRRLVVRQGMIPVVIGLIAGVAAGFAVGKAASNLFFEVRAADPIIVAAVVLVVAVIGIVACYIPAIRTARLNPLIALRSQ